MPKVLHSLYHWRCVSLLTDSSHTALAAERYWTCATGNKACLNLGQIISDPEECEHMLKLQVVCVNRQLPKMLLHMCSHSAC